MVETGDAHTQTTVYRKGLVLLEKPLNYLQNGLKEKMENLVSQ